MARTTQRSRSTTTGRRRSARAGGDSRVVVDQITKIVSANQALQREVKDLTAENARLRAQLQEIGSALGKLTGSRRGARGARGLTLVAAAEARPRQQRKPITDPELLERRRQALAKARAARAEKLAAARAAKG